MLLAACRPPSPPPVAPAAAEASLQDEATVFYLNGELALVDGDLAEARRCAAWMLRLTHDAWSAVRASKLLLGADDPKGAAEAAREALAIDPALPEAHRALGLALLRTDPAEALVHLARAPGLPDVVPATVRASLATGDPEGAARALDGWSPDVPADQLAHARATALLGRHEQAVTEALAVADHPGIGPEALALAADEARATCDRRPIAAWVADHPTAAAWPAFADVMGAVAADLGDSALSAKVASHRPVSTPSPAQEVARQADALLSEGRIEEVLALTEPWPVDPHVAWMRAGALVVDGRVDEAVDLARRTGADPVDADVRAARVWLLAERSIEAAEAARSALASNACAAGALDLLAGLVEPCEAAPLLDRLALARPSQPGVDERRTAAGRACGDRGQP
ncbi:MAG: hypothetical protein H6738_09800 [Alphaproteobacteria bacterium]|nr:hypothetical protein [Alphaproteobacteria bacterium]MCB9697059.1 hypothetical protein [Alphaproteobacteria bacterium]